jgi:type II secretory pathway pseudopilin PulG
MRERARRGPGSRRGSTLLEAVAAVAILSIAAAAAFATHAFVIRAQIREHRAISCAELASRLVLQYLDDDTSMPDPALPIQGRSGGRDRYRWRMDRSAVELEPDPAAGESAQTAADDDARRLERITITVWLSEESGGDRLESRSPVRSELSRLVWRGALRTPDQMKRLLDDPVRFADWALQQFGAAPPAPARGGGGAR